MKTSGINKINFKKIAIIYIIAAAIAGIFSIGFLGFTFKDKLTLLYNYNRVSEKVEDNENGMDAIKSDLTALAEKSSDIADILILDSENNILFSAKNSVLAKNDSLELISSTDREHHFLTDKANPNMVFRLVNDNSLQLMKDMLGRDIEVEQGYNDDYFYDNNFSDKQVYLLSYLVDQASGSKIYFISDIQPVANGELYVKAVAALSMLFFMLYWVLIALWIYTNAHKSNLNAAVWGILALFTNLAGLLVYLIYKQGNQTCYKCHTVQSKTNIYCTICGAKIGSTCDNCHSVINDKDSYCKTCGNEIIKK